jgi:uncharacterized protein (DUF2342 family)
MVDDPTYAAFMASRPGDDELPPDPFPGDPFANDAVDPAADEPPAASTVGGPFAALFSQLAQSAPGAGSLNADVARHLAVWTAAGGVVEPNIEPLDRIRVETIGGQARELVEEVTGLAVPMPRGVLASTKAEWAADALVGWRPLLDGLAAGASATLAAGTGADAAEAEEELTDQLRMLGLGALPGGFSGLARMLAPTLAGMQAGTLLGQLGTSALGTYDSVVPRQAGADLRLVVSGVAAFSAAWTLAADHARTQIIVRDLVSHAVLTLPHVAGPLADLATRHAAAGHVDPSGLADDSELGGLAGLLGGGMAGLAGLMGGGGPTSPSADAFLAGEPTPEQLRLRSQIRLLTVPLIAVIDYFSSAIGARMLGDNRQVVEALRRRRLDRDDGARLIEHLLGIGVDQVGLDSGRAFVGGVLERAGHDGLSALFAGEGSLPTANELAAPGLWLARLGLDEPGQ